jgi:hypothetical protein
MATPIRYPFTGITRDGNGNIIPSATVKVFLSGTTTPASVYAASSGGVVATSVTSDSTGTFIFYVSNASYTGNQMFKVRIEKEGYATHDYDRIVVFGLNYLLDEPVELDLDCTEITTCVALCNAIKAALIAKGLCVEVSP